MASVLVSSSHEIIAGVEGGGIAESGLGKLKSLSSRHAHVSVVCQFISAVETNLAAVTVASETVRWCHGSAILFFWSLDNFGLLD